jgi:phosphopantetheine--protein transferase-like protein
MHHPIILIISQISRVEPNLLKPEQNLNSLNINKSLGLALIRSAVERKLKIKCDWINWDTTIQDLIDKTENSIIRLDKDKEINKSTNSNSVSPNIKKIDPRKSFVGLGIDIQEINDLPEIKGSLQDDPFYSKYFSTAELQYAHTKADIRAHLAGIWCAKEAIKKTSDSLMEIDFKEIDISHDVKGKPFVLPLNNFKNLNILLSISYNKSYAIASAIAS